MPWFRVDDTFHAHRKVAGLIDLGGQRAANALALWVTAGSWSANALTDGFVSEAMARRLSTVSRWKRAAKDLEAVGLWVPEVHPETGAKGWRFHDWCDLQPVAANVLEKREKEREKKRRQRSSSPGLSLGDTAGTDSGTLAGARDPDPDPDPIEGRSPNPPPRREGPRATGTNPRATKTNPRATGTNPRAKRGTRLADDWQPSAELVTYAANNPRVRLDADEVARCAEDFRDYWHAATGAKATKLDWDATFRTWLRRHRDRNPGIRAAPRVLTDAERRELDEAKAAAEAKIAEERAQLELVAARTAPPPRPERTPEDLAADRARAADHARALLDEPPPELEAILANRAASE